MNVHLLFHPRYVFGCLACERNRDKTTSECSAPTEEVTLTVTDTCHCLSGGDPHTCPIHRDGGSVFGGAHAV